MGKNCNGDCTICAQSNLDCDGVFKEWVKKPVMGANFHIFKPYFDVGLGKVVNSKREIREYCKSYDMIYAGDKELTQQAKENREYNAKKQDREFEKKLVNKLLEVC